MLVGHWRDPNRDRNTFADQEFIEVKRINEQVMVLRRSHELRPDPHLPGNHHIGKDLPRSSSESSLRSHLWL
jgi:hypothetical protein